MHNFSFDVKRETKNFSKNFNFGLCGVFIAPRSRPSGNGFEMNREFQTDFGISFAKTCTTRYIISMLIIKEKNFSMTNTLHYQLLAGHTLFQRTFLRNIRRSHPELLPGQPKVIDFLMYTDHAYQREIADACLLEPSTLSLILEKMENAGLVHREKQPDNKKNSVVRLSKHGRAIGNDILCVFRETEEQLCRGMAPGDLETLSRALQTLFRNAKEVQL